MSKALSVGSSKFRGDNQWIPVDLVFDFVSSIVILFFCSTIACPLLAEFNAVVGKSTRDRSQDKSSTTTLLQSSRQRQHLLSFACNGKSQKSLLGRKRGCIALFQRNVVIFPGLGKTVGGFCVY